ncbi:hypothetical protein SO802_006086 [Lithocarpus litseifolius]|uniref:CCHC-type domain-containing protein n=1 Tax=Lithocarpus litseifolius TaxID=425828 RepID=A0AAW2DMW2_9ROSI
MEIKHLENQFRGLEVKRLHRPTPTNLTKNWYPRPTPPDLQFEERNVSNQFLVSSSKLYEWNIDEESKEDIKHAVQKYEEGLLVFDEHIGKGIPYGVNALIHTIMKHFVGKPSNITSRIYDQLSNLRCRTLGNYRWYEDVFTTRVMHKSDCNSPFWKKKFINGLPRVFGEKNGKQSRSKSTGKHEKSMPKALRKCFNCGKRGHFRKECRSKAKSLIDTLVSDQTCKDEIFKLLELDHTKSESVNSSSDQEIYQLN